MEWTNELIFDFLNLYEKEPCLWNVSLPEHKNKHDAYDAWLRIKAKLKDGNIPIKEIKKKRDNLMSTYRRQRSKVLRRISETDEVYKPEWPFYLVMARFLDDVYNPRKRKSSEDPEEEDEDEESRTSFKRAATPPTVQVPQPKRAKPAARPARRPAQPAVAARPEHTHDPCASCAVSNYLRRRDEAEIIAKGWALELEKMDEMQQLFAKKAINDIIVEGRLGNLHKDAVQFTPASPHEPTAAWLEMEQEEEEQDGDESDSEYEVKPVLQSDPMPGTSTS